MTKILVAIILLVGSVGLAQEVKTPPELSSLREEYHRRQEIALQPVIAWYQEQLQQLEQRALQRNDPEAALALKQERDSLVASSVGMPTLTIIKATYGAGDHTADVTKQVQALIVRNVILLKAPWGFGVDPAFGKAKKVTIRYSYDGTERTVDFGQHQTISLP